MIIINSNDQLLIDDQWPMILVKAMILTNENDSNGNEIVMVLLIIAWNQW